MRATIQAVQPWAASIAIIVGALIIGAAMVRSQFIDRYEISAAGDGSNVWRINARTGDVQLCAIIKDENLFAKFDPDGPKADVVCKRTFRSTSPEK